MITFKLPDDWYLYFPDHQEDFSDDPRHRSTSYGFVKAKIPIVDEFNGHMVLRSEQMIIRSSTGSRPEISMQVMLHYG